MNAPSNDENTAISGLGSVLDLVNNQGAAPAPDDAAVPEPEVQAPAKRFGRTLPQNYGDRVEQVQEEPAAITEIPIAPEVIEYTRPDGTMGKLELPADPTERAKKIASLASGTDAYEAGRNLVRDKAPELSEEWRGLLKVQQDTLKTIQDNQQAQAQQKYDPVDALTADQREYYDYLKDERGDDREAALYLKDKVTTNLMIFETNKGIEEQKREVLRQKVLSRTNEIRLLDPSLPSPARGNEANFQKSFYSGFGGWLLEQGFSEEQIFFSENINLETLHNVYKSNSGQSQKKLSDSVDIKNSEAKADVVAKATISPEVAKSIKDVQGGSLSASIGNSDFMEKYSKAESRSDIRNLDRQDGGKFGINALEGLGLARFLPKK